MRLCARFGVTALALAALVALGRLTVPGVDPSSFERMRGPMALQVGALGLAAVLHQRSPGEPGAGAVRLGAVLALGGVAVARGVRVDRVGEGRAPAPGFAWVEVQLAVAVPAIVAAATGRPAEASWAAGLIAAGLAAALTLLWPLPGALGRAWGGERRGVAPLPALVAAAAAGGVFLAATVLQARGVPSDPTQLVAVWVAAAVGFDLHFEARARGLDGPAWVVYRAYEVAPLVRRLAVAGIPAHARGARYGFLSPLLSPYAPIELLVAPDQVEAARRTLTAKES